jgi:hypothetical protein
MKSTCGWARRLCFLLLLATQFATAGRDSPATTLGPSENTTVAPDARECIGDLHANHDGSFENG